MSDLQNGSKHFDKMVQIFNTTGKVFSYWHDVMNLYDRHDVCDYLKINYEYHLVLNAVAEKAANP